MEKCLKQKVTPLNNATQLKAGLLLMSRGGSELNIQERQGVSKELVKVNLMQ